ncbi:hypothetical protein VP01_99g3 [Puccinia sorghi]|uniref:Uncharacterized protein n=1 Tax=Puccinia sorghi TaxID=27349 RepID=A0A0L6U564_9BASI|nr:hypothetical protein VP01_99g3 [Puccinia sorghi]
MKKGFRSKMEVVVTKRVVVVRGMNVRVAPLRLLSEQKFRRLILLRLADGFLSEGHQLKKSRSNTPSHLKYMSSVTGAKPAPTSIFGCLFGFRNSLSLSSQIVAEMYILSLMHFLLISAALCEPSHWVTHPCRENARRGPHWIAEDKCLTGTKDLTRSARPEVQDASTQKYGQSGLCPTSLATVSFIIVIMYSLLPFFSFVFFIQWIFVFSFYCKPKSQTLMKIQGENEIQDHINNNNAMTSKAKQINDIIKHVQLFTSCRVFSRDHWRFLDMNFGRKFHDPMFSFQGAYVEKMKRNRTGQDRNREQVLELGQEITSKNFKKIHDNTNDSPPKILFI